MKPLISMRQAISDPGLLGSAFPRKAGTPDSWVAWRAMALAAMGESLRPKELSAYRQLTQRQEPPGERVEEVVIIKGRRSGGTTFCAVMVAYQAALIDYSDVLGVGETATALLLAPSQRQADVAFSRVEGIFDASPLLQSMIVSRTKDSLVLNNNVTIEVLAASYRSVRGLSLACAVVDEASFLFSEASNSRNSDVELTNALRPALLTTRGALILSSTPYAREGEVYTSFERYFGKEDAEVLVARAGSRDTNPTLSESVITRALERDPVAARAEFLGEFRTDVSGFIGRDLLLQAVDAGVTERLPSPEHQYVAFCDAASGIASSGDGDRFALAIGHREGDVVVIDCCRRWMPPFNASEITGEAAAIARAYRCAEVISDGFSSGYLRAELMRHGVGHRISEFDKSKLYLATLPALTSKRVRLLDLKFLVDEFASLERRTGNAGHDRIDARGHEDAANVCAGVIAQFAAAKQSSAENWIEVYRRMAESSALPPGPNYSPEVGFRISPAFSGAKERVRVPDGISTLYLIDGSAMNVPEDRVVEVSKQDAAAFGQRGWERLAIV
jgi:hypothetical protein